MSKLVVIVTRDVGRSMRERAKRQAKRVVRVSWATNRIWLTNGAVLQFIHEVVAAQQAPRYDYDEIQLEGDLHYMSPEQWRELKGRARDAR